MSQWEIQNQSKRLYPRNLRTYCLLQSLIHVVANKKIVLCQHGETCSLDNYSEMFSSYQHITLRTTNLALLPKTNVMMIILIKYQINGRCRLRFLFLHYKDSKIRLLVYATCLKSFHTEKQWVLQGHLFVCSRLAALLGWQLWTSMWTFADRNTSSFLCHSQAKEDFRLLLWLIEVS